MLIMKRRTVCEIKTLLSKLLPCCFLVRRKLSDVFDHPFDNLGVAFSEGRHQAGNLPVVLRVDVGSG